jgi:outer membrane protein TolC
MISMCSSGRICCRVSLTIVVRCWLIGLWALGAAAATDRQPLLDAVRDAPMVRAAGYRTAAAEAGGAAVGRLPDPELELMYSRVSTPMDSFPMWELTVRQSLPKAGERGAQRAMAQARTDMAEAERVAMAAVLARDVALMLIDEQRAAQRRTLLEEQYGRMRALLDALETRIGTAAARGAERLMVQARLQAMRRMIEQEVAMAADAADAVRGMLGLPPASQLPPLAVPALDSVRAAGSARHGLTLAQRDEAQAQAAMARASGRPMSAVALRYEREDERTGRMQSRGIALMIEIPWQSRAVAGARGREAHAAEAAAIAEAEALDFELGAILAQAQRAEQLVATTRGLVAETRRQLDGEYAALVSSAGSGEAGMGIPILMLLEIFERDLEAQLQLIADTAAAQQARARLWLFAPSAWFAALR